MNDTFFDGHDELYHHAKFGEDRTMRVGCSCENVVFFVRHALSPEHRAFEGCIVRTSIVIAVAVYCPIFTRFSSFFRSYCSFRHATQFSHSLQGGATIFREIAVKNCEKSKLESAEKIVHTTSHR